MFAVVYLSAKLGQVSGRSLFQAIKDHCPAYVLCPSVLCPRLIGVLIDNTIEAGADLGGMAAAGAYLHSAPEAMDLPHHRDRHPQLADSRLVYVDPKHIPHQRLSEGDHRSEVYAKDFRAWSGPHPRLRRRAMPSRSASQTHGATSVLLRSREDDFRAIGHSPEVARVPRHAELTCVPPARGCVRPRRYDRRRRGSAACATRRTGHRLTRFLHPA
jgi:hypothetical protein